MSEDRSRQVYIGYLPNDARMEDVEDFFKGMKLFFFVTCPLLPIIIGSIDFLG